MQLRFEDNQVEQCPVSAQAAMSLIASLVAAAATGADTPNCSPVVGEHLRIGGLEPSMDALA